MCLTTIRWVGVWYSSIARVVEVGVKDLDSSAPQLGLAPKMCDCPPRVGMFHFESLSSTVAWSYYAIFTA